MDPAQLRADIPLGESVYLNTGASGPAPDRVLEAGRAHQASHEREWTLEDDPYAAAWAGYEETRERVAAFAECSPDQISLCESTADGISRIANALEWTAGDCVVRTDLEHPAGVLPWARLEEEGIEVREVPAPGGRLDFERLHEALEGADLLCFNSISWIHGTQLDIERACAAAHEHGALALVDAVQTPGQSSFDPTGWNADFVVGAGHKWLLGVWGAGFLYVDADVVERLRPRHVSYRSVTDMEQVPLEYHAGARRLEVGTSSLGPHAALREALDIHAELGLETIERHIEGLVERLVDHLPADRLVSPARPESGLVAFEVEDADATVERLAAEDVIVRTLPRPDTVRASVHVFNTAEDIDRLAGALAG